MAAMRRPHSCHPPSGLTPGASLAVNCFNVKIAVFMIALNVDLGVCLETIMKTAILRIVGQRGGRQGGARGWGIVAALRSRHARSGARYRPATPAHRGLLHDRCR